jgi:hypothetical protein
MLAPFRQGARGGRGGDRHFFVADGWKLLRNKPGSYQSVTYYTFFWGLIKKLIRFSLFLCDPLTLFHQYFIFFGVIREMFIQILFTL